MISEKIKEYRKNWVKNNKQKVYENHKRYRERNILLWKILNWEYYKKNKKRILENGKKWAKENQDKIRAYKSKPEEILKQKARDKSKEKISLIDKKCEFCGEKIKLQRHHPDYNKPFDIIILCVKCHTEWHKIKRLVNNS